MELHPKGMYPHQMQECHKDNTYQQKGVSHPKRKQQKCRGFVLDFFPTNTGRGLRGRGDCATAQSG